MVDDLYMVDYPITFASYVFIAAASMWLRRRGAELGFDVGRIVLEILVRACDPLCW